MMPFSLGYFKGKTRVAVLMAMLSVARDSGCDKYDQARKFVTSRVSKICSAISGWQDFFYGKKIQAHIFFES